MVFKTLDKWGEQAHEQVLFCSHSPTGLKAIIAIHNTSLGPALGGCRMYPYKTEERALEDALRLSSAMTYKAALAGLPIGGGKSVIIADPQKDKNPSLLKAFGSHIESLKGRYIVAKDMGITTEDIQYIGNQSSYVVGRPVKKGGVGDPSQSTAKGVFYGIKEAVKIKLKKDSLKGVRVLVQGLGAVGSHLVQFLATEQAEIFVFDINPLAVKRVQSHTPKIKVISQEKLFSTSCEVFAPCAMGSIINEDSARQLACSIVAGAANNQLSDFHIGEHLRERDILYIPDFIINSGGLIYVSSYLEPKKTENWIESKLKNIPLAIKAVCEASFTEGLDTAQIALNLAKEKIEQAGLTKGMNTKEGKVKSSSRLQA